MSDLSTLAGRVRVIAGQPPRTVGAGIQLAGEFVLTCWHVVQGDAGAAASIAVATGGDEIGAHVVWSQEIGPHGDGDLAVLRTAATLASPAAGFADYGDLDLDVRLIGYPAAAAPAQVLARARLIGPHDPVTGWRQLDRVASATVAVDRGFSGAAVFEPGGRVVGMAVARSTLGQQTVGWMLPVATLRRLLPGQYADALTTAPRMDPPTSVERTALARALAEIPTVADPLARAELVMGLPDEIRLGIRTHHRLGLDSRELIVTALDRTHGLGDLYQALLEREGPTSISLRAFRDLARSMRLLPQRHEEG
jgi:S1-C subfamily serine protease